MRRIFIIVTTLLALAVAAYGFVEARHEEQEHAAPPTVRVNPVVVAPVLVEKYNDADGPANLEAAAPLLIELQRNEESTGYSGYAGAFEHDGRLALYWKDGAIPPAVWESLKIWIRLPVDIYSTKFSGRELSDASSAVLKQLVPQGLCSARVASGGDAVQLSGPVDPATIDYPQTTPEGIPVIITQSGCPQAL